MRKIREQEEEERKKLLDIEEERLASERRREHIDKAKQLQYYDTDRVRTFHARICFSRIRSMASDVFLFCCRAHFYSPKC